MRRSIAGRSREHIAGEALHLGRRKVTVADLFEVEDRGEPEIAVRGEESEITQPHGGTT